MRIRPRWSGRWPPPRNRIPTTCAPSHAQGLTAPKGWEVVRPDEELADAAARSDDLEALANAVREAGRAERVSEPVPAGTGRRGHLRVLRTPES